MTVNHIETKGSWRSIADCSNVTISKEAGLKEPSSRWKRRMLLCEHSPIRNMTLDFVWKGLKYWVSVHFVRHKIGVEHYVSTQRTDRTQIDRDTLPQDSLVDHRISLNPQAMINISRKRLCKCASTETRTAWKELLETIKESEPELYSVCVPDCLYRSYCYEFNSCGYSKTKDFEKRLEEYRR